MRVLCLCSAIPASARTYTPPPGKVWAGLAGGTSIDQWQRLTNHHPPMFEDYMTWNSGTTWLANPRPAFRSRLALHMSTASGKGVRGVISPQGIARGRSDNFLVTMNRNLAHSRRIFYIRIMGEANGYWNAYCPYNKNGTSRGARFSTNNYRQAWRRTVLILRGGRVTTIDKRLRALKMHPIKANVTRWTKLPHPRVTFIWAPQAHGDPNIPQNEPKAFWPGSGFVDWVGTDFYEGDNFNYLNAYYSQFTGGKPFDLSEWGVVGYDHPSFVHDIFNWVRSHPHVQMFNFQGYGSSNPYNPHHYPKSVAALRKELRSAKSRGTRMSSGIRPSTRSITTSRRSRASPASGPTRR